MSAHYTAQATAPETATDSAIRALIEKLATAYGRAFIPSNATYTPEMLGIGRALVRACGVPDAVADAMRGDGITSFYSVARKSPEAARRMALKHTRASAPPAPSQPLPGLPATVDPETIRQAIADAMATLASDVLTSSRSETERLLADHTASLPALVASELARIAPRPVVVTIADKPPVTVERAHSALDHVLTLCVARKNVYLWGDRGTGKTTLAMQIAEVMGLRFRLASSVFEEHKLFGYMNAAGEYVSTDFRTCWEEGGVFCFDELDRSDPGVVVAFNAPLANDIASFPDGLIKRHPDCVIIAAGNTPMRGATREYNTAQKMDASVLDRFYTVHLDIDLELEAALCVNRDWLAYCLALREAAAAQSIDLAVSPRASIEGATDLALGLSWQQVADGRVWKGLDTASRERLEAAVPMARFETSIL